MSDDTFVTEFRFITIGTEFEHDGRSYTKCGNFEATTDGSEREAFGYEDAVTVPFAIAQALGLLAEDETETKTEANKFSIEINPQQIHSVMASQIEESLKDALGSYKVQSKIADTLKESALAEVLDAQVAETIKALHSPEMMQKLAEELRDGLIATTREIFRESLVTTIARLRGVNGSRMSHKDVAEKHDEIRKSLFGNTA